MGDFERPIETGRTTQAPKLDANTERELIRRLLDGSDHARHQLILAHMRLVGSVAQRYVRDGTPFEDLIHEGVLGLLEAASRFDPSRGARFSTYATWWVRAYVRRYALSNRRIVAAPSTRDSRRALSQLRRTQHLLAQRHGVPASNEQLAEALDVGVDDVEMAEGVLSGRDVGLDGDGPGSRHIEPPTEEPTPEQSTEEAERLSMYARRLARAMELLSDREREIVRRRLLAEEPDSLAALGQELGVSRERVRQIQQRAQEKLRSGMMRPVNDTRNGHSR